MGSHKSVSRGDAHPPGEVADFIDFTEVAAPATPASGFGRLYVATDGTLHFIDDAGTDIELGAGGGGGGSALLDYTQFTSGASITATTEGGADTVVTASAVVLGGSTNIDIEFYSPSVRPRIDVADYGISFWLYDGSSSIGKIASVVTPDAGYDNKPVYVRVRLSAPSAASHTYSIRASVDAGTGLVDAGAGGSGNLFPGYIRITESPT